MDSKSKAEDAFLTRVTVPIVPWVRRKRLLSRVGSVGNDAVGSSIYKETSVSFPSGSRNIIRTAYDVNLMSFGSIEGLISSCNLCSKDQICSSIILTLDYQSIQREREVYAYNCNTII